MEQLIFGIPAIALVVGMTELAKKIGIAKRWAPLASLISGIILVLVADMNPYWGPSLVNGIVLGLMASGTYSGVKSLIGK